MNTTSTITLPTVSRLPAASPIARLTRALRRLRMRLASTASAADFMALDPKDLIHEALPQHPADRIRRETVDHILASCPYLR